MADSQPPSVTRRRARDPRLGTWLADRYLIEERIATGGFGAVYRARTAGGDPLALKLLHPALHGDPHVLARFRREGRALIRLHDPHTVATLAVGEADGTPYIAMELLAGESLSARLTREHMLPWQTAVAIARAVCSSLAEAHALGVVHRDLKPDNIQVETRRGNAGDRGGAGAGEVSVKVIDFGIVRIAPGSAIDDGCELTSAGYMIGTYDYMSPEQIVGEPCEVASDIYSLGVVLYEMLAGRRPFARPATPAALMTALLMHTPQPPSVFAAVPPGLDRIVMRCLAREPERRFASMRELAEALDVLTARLAAQRPGAREDVTAPHPACPEPRSLAPARRSAPGGRVVLRSHTGEDAAICRDPTRSGAIFDTNLGATWTDLDLRRPLAHPPPMGLARGSARGLCGCTPPPGVPMIIDRPRPPSGPIVVEATQPSATAMLAPSIPTSPLARLVPPPRPPRPTRSSTALVLILICAALAAGLATFLLAALIYFSPAVARDRRGLGAYAGGSSAVAEVSSVGRRPFWTSPGPTV